MRSKLLLPLVVVVVFAGAPCLRGADSPRAIIERAVRAQGIPMGKPEPNASFLKIKGLIHAAGGASFTGEGFQQVPKKSKLVLDLVMGGGRVSLIEVRNGAQGWILADGQTQDLDAKRLMSFERSDYVDRVTSLVTLLSDKRFTLTALGESKVEGQEAVGVKVASKGMPDVSLSFAKGSGLLLKSEYRDKDNPDEREAQQETFYSDYRELNYAAADEATLRAAGRSVDGPALLELFRSQTLSPADRTAMKVLVKQLGDRSFRKREQAVDSLVKFGGAALAILRKAARSEDPEVARRARQCLQQIESESGDVVLAGAARLLALRRPARTAEVLLAYVPDAASDPVARDVQAALVAVARPGGKDDPVLLGALDDKDPARRAAATVALGRDGGAWERQPGRRVYVPGLKQAMRVLCRRDGEKFDEWEVLDFQFFNQLDDAVFAKP